MKEDSYLKRFFNLSFTLAKSEFILRNEGSYLGVLWYLLNPILLFTLLFLIFYDRLGHSIPYYALYIFIGIVMYNFFMSATIVSTRSIIGGNKWLIKSINFPRESLVASVVIQFLFSHILEIVLLIVFLIIFKLSLLNIIYYLFIVILFSIFIFGVSLILATFTIYFVDLENIWIFISRLLWFATPIFYEISGQVRLYNLNLFNPIFYYITLSREILITSRFSNTYYLIICLLNSFIFLIIGLLIFNKYKNKFGELI